MYGFPKVFSTKQDFYNVRDMYPEQTKDKLKELMEGMKIWVATGELEENASGITDTTHKVIETTKGDMGSEETVNVQMELVEDDNSEFYRMGWTKEEAAIFLAYQPKKESN